MESIIQSQAFYLTKVGEPEQAFELREFTISKIEENEVVVEAEAFGLNFADVVARRGLYREAPPFPCIIGYETVGTVVKIGKNVDRNLMNRRVVAFCRFGGYSKHVLTMDYAVVPVDTEPAEELLSLCTQGVTAYYMAMYLTPIHKIDTVLIHAAAGGVGTFLVQLAKLRGATVIAKIGSQEKEELVKNLGADHIVNYKTADYEQQIKAIMKGDRIDISFNPVAGGTYKKDMRLLGSGGRVVLFGGAELGKAKWGIISKLGFVKRMGFLLPIELMMRSKNILGVNMLKIADNRPEIIKECLKNVMELYKNHQIKPHVGGKYNSEELIDAHRLLESGKSQGKISVFW